MHFSPSSNDDTAELSCLSEELENYLYVYGFVGDCTLGSLLIPSPNPTDPPGTTLDALVQYWLGMDRRRYGALPFFVRQAKVQAAYQRELRALEQGQIPKLDPPHTRQTIEDIYQIFTLMDAYDRVIGIQNRVRRVLKVEVNRQLQSNRSVTE